MDIGSESDSLPDEISSILSSLINGGRVELSSDSSPPAVPLRDYNRKSPSPNCANVIILPYFTFEHVSHGMYDTVGCIVIVSEYGCDEYVNT